jgi:hypothetical protein
MAKDQTLFTARQYEFSCERLEECGRMVGGWLKQVAGGRRFDSMAWQPKGMAAKWRRPSQRHVSPG